MGTAALAFGIIALIISIVPLCGMIAQAKEKRQGPGKTEKKRMPGMMVIDREGIRLYADADPEERKP